ncbi:MAG: polysaccharide deacetylase family protein [Candidatus Heimdallarchaeaceae archaeon]
MVEEEKVPVTFILHAYQPITQRIEILERIVNNCYIPFFENLSKKPNVRITLNITGCLLEVLATKYPYVLELIEKCISSGQIEIMGSAFYHPLLPLISIENQKYEIGKQKEIIQNILGMKSTVFFPPELAVSEEILSQISDKGYTTVIVPENINSEPFGCSYILESGKSIQLIKRNKELSNKISFNHYNRNISHCVIDLEIQHRQTNRPIIMAMDMETFGEHMAEYYFYFFNLADRIETMTLSSCLNRFPLEAVSDVFIPSSWSTTKADIEAFVPYPLWNHPYNSVHQLQHTHLRLLHQIKRFLLDGDWIDEYHAAYYSCQFWWASKDWWAPELIHTGLKYQRNVLAKMIEELSKDSQQIILNLSNDIIQKIVDIASQLEDKNEHSIYFS